MFTLSKMATIFCFVGMLTSTLQVCMETSRRDCFCYWFIEFLFIA